MPDFSQNFNRYSYCLNNPLLYIDQDGYIILFGGLSRGIADHRNGYSFWNGTKTLTFGLSNQNTSDIVANYNTSDAAIENDLFLKERMNNMYGVSEGDFGIKKITTMGNSEFSVNTDGLYVENSTNEIIGGYADLISNGKTSFHVSPYYTLTPDDVMFRVVSGHELVHTYHNFVLPKVDRIMTERVAYQYSSDVLVANCRLVDYANAMRWGSTYMQYRGSYPSQYNIPRSIFRLR
jgi:hypothetical protein